MERVEGEGRGETGRRERVEREKGEGRQGEGEGRQGEGGAREDNETGTHAERSQAVGQSVVYERLECVVVVVETEQECM
ncbi:hypothetical protein Pcinc_012656 [Petrolisthes cinctipes]|uniref:Uncharacterized protein n=1 Tax=Petrolisthes cinctipes TaxID=88211 RepID=A0AAE1FYL7_PETCI|nr:hypothetical protein Pcinc_012656 [Petrolisthes cinctipes]